MNPPNTLTLSRLVLAFVLMLCLSATFPLAKSLALLVFIAAAVTDYFDGYLARTTYGVTSFGRLMDPLTDKVLVCAAFISFVEMHVVPAWIVVIVIAREFLVTGLRLLGASKGKIIGAGRWGKHKTVWQIVAITALLFGMAVRDDVLRRVAAGAVATYDRGFRIIAYGVSAAVLLITVATGLAYFLEHRDLIRRHLE